VATETHNLALACEESEGRLARLPGEWHHPTKRMEDFTPASTEKVPWKCGQCEWEWNAKVQDRTKSKRASNCPECYRSAHESGLMHSFYKRRTCAGVEEGD
jgi:hypothetical protein